MGATFLITTQNKRKMADFSKQRAPSSPAGGPSNDILKRIEDKIKETAVHLEELDKSFQELNSRVESLEKSWENVEFEVEEEPEKKSTSSKKKRSK